MTQTDQPDIVLVLEASSPKGSVALFRNRLLVQRCDVPMGTSREDALFPAIQTVLRLAQLSPTAVDTVVCGSGPGSFTSLRIAGALAKGLAHATGSRLYAVPSLLLAAASYGVAGSYVVHADALRGERYVMPVAIDDHGNVRSSGSQQIVAGNALNDFAGNRELLAVGGSGETSGQHAVIPDAALLLHITHWDVWGRVDLATWEPSYGRLAEAQVKWETAHNQSLPAL